MVCAATHTYLFTLYLCIANFFDKARIRVGEKLLSELPQVSEDTTLQFLIPTTTGPGVCSFALVDYLIVQHNSFIDMCQVMMSEQDKRLY